MRLPVRERTFYEIETLLRGFFSNLRGDYAPQMPDHTRVDYAQCGPAAKYGIEICPLRKYSPETLEWPRDISRWARVRFCYTHIQIPLYAKTLFRESGVR